MGVILLTCIISLIHRDLSIRGLRSNILYCHGLARFLGYKVGMKTAWNGRCTILDIANLFDPRQTPASWTPNLLEMV